MQPHRSSRWRVYGKREENAEARDRALIAGFDVAEALSSIRLFNKQGVTRDEQQRAGRAFAALTAPTRPRWPPRCPRWRSASRSIRCARAR